LASPPSPTRRPSDLPAAQRPVPAPSPPPPNFARSAFAGRVYARRRSPLSSTMGTMRLPRLPSLPRLADLADLAGLADRAFTDLRDRKSTRPNSSHVK